jgi:hypothetical protein
VVLPSEPGQDPFEQLVLGYLRKRENAAALERAVHALDKSVEQRKPLAMGRVLTASELERLLGQLRAESEFPIRPDPAPLLQAPAPIPGDAGGSAGK